MEITLYFDRKVDDSNYMNNTTNEKAMASLAVLMGLSPIEAIALPATIDVAARKMNMLPSRMLWIALNYSDVRDYLSSVCRNAVSE